jgi:alpha-amylase
MPAPIRGTAAALGAVILAGLFPLLWGWRRRYPAGLRLRRLFIAGLCLWMASCAHSPPIPPTWGSTSLEERVIYFVMVDRFEDGDPQNNRDVDTTGKGTFHGGDLAGLTHRMDHLAALGVTTLWISPVVKQVDSPVYGAGFADWAYHGYWAEDFSALEPRLGTRAELDSLLDAAHSRGIEVIVDVVLNHAGYGSSWARDPRWTRSESGGTCPGPGEGTELTQCLFGLPDFRTEDPTVSSAIVNWHVGWIERHSFDGFRLDTLKHVEPELFVQLHREAERVSIARGGGDLFVVGEHWGALPGDETTRRLVEMGAVDTLIDFGFHGLVESFLAGRMRAEAAAHHLSKRHEASGPPLVHFLDSHDVPTLMAQLTADGLAHRYPLAAVLQFTVAGIPQVTWGNELGRAGGEWPDNRSDMPWEALETREGQELMRIWSELIALRRAHEDLRGRDFETLQAQTTEEGALLVYRRGAFVVVIALGEAPALDVSTLAENPDTITPRFRTGEDWVPRLSKGRLSAEVPPDSAAIFEIH